MQIHTEDEPKDEVRDTEIESVYTVTKYIEGQMSKWGKIHRRGRERDREWQTKNDFGGGGVMDDLCGWDGGKPPFGWNWNVFAIICF